MTETGDFISRYHCCFRENPEENASAAFRIFSRSIRADFQATRENDFQPADMAIVFMHESHAPGSRARAAIRYQDRSKKRGPKTAARPENKAHPAIKTGASSGPRNASGRC